MLNKYISTKEDKMQKVARFEKVSKEQYKKDFDVNAWAIQSDDPILALNWCYDNIQLPRRATKGSAGHDFFTPCDLVITPHSTAFIKTGIKCQIDEGFVLEVYPRSSLGFKYRVSLSNTVGIIDSDYYNNEKNEGHIMIKLYNPNSNPITIKRGEAFAQGIFKQFFVADEEEITTERVGGMGSTNK